MELFKNRRAVTQTQIIAIVVILVAAVVVAWYYTSQITPPADIDLGVILISQGSTEEDLTSYHVSVDYEDLLPREAEIRVHHNPDSNGTVFFVTNTAISIDCEEYG